MISQTDPSIEERFELFDTARMYENRDIDRADMKRQWRRWQQERYSRLYSWPITLADRCFSRYLKGYLIVRPTYIDRPKVKESEGHAMYKRIIDKIHNTYYMHPSTSKAYHDHVDIFSYKDYAKVIYDGEIKTIFYNDKINHSMIINISNRINLMRDIENANNREFTFDAI